MTVMSQQVVDHDRRASSLYDVLELILDKGLVIDAYIRVSLVGIEILTIDARIVVASVDTYLQFAEIVNRVDLTQTKDSRTLTDMIGDVTEKGSRRKTKGALSGAADTISGALHKGGSGQGEKSGKSKDRSTTHRRKTKHRQAHSRHQDDE